MSFYDLTSTRGCMRAVVHLRHSARLVVDGIERVRGMREATRRKVKLLRQRGDVFSVKLADRLEACTSENEAAAKPLYAQLTMLGAMLFELAPAINEKVPQGILMDLLNINPVDRVDIKPGDGLVELVFSHALENSVEQRDKDFHDSPMFQIAHRHFATMLRSENPALHGAAMELFLGRSMPTITSGGECRVLH